MTYNKPATAHRLRQLVFAAVAAATVAHAAENFEMEFDPRFAQEWKELELAVPAYPEEHNLAAVPRDRRDSARLYLDRSSISVGKDGIARFTAVLESASGARNVLHEGIRCQTGEYKTYAIGTSAGAFQPIKKPQWRPIPEREVNGFRRDLYEHHLCARLDARRPSDIVRSLSNVSASFD